MRWILSDPRYRVLVVGSHPVQYTAPLFRQMTRHPRLDLSVAYCTLRGAEAVYDSEFGQMVQWDIPLLDGYVWQEVPSRGFGERFWGLNNPGLGKLIKEHKFDAVLCYLSYRCASFWITYFACRRAESAFLFGTDAASLVPRSGRRWKVGFKKVLWPRLFSLADQVLVPSNATRELMRSIGIPEERITLTPYSVDNDWWILRSHKANREAVRSSWGAGPQTMVILFCAKLQPWKRPGDILEAFAQSNLPDSLLIFAGEGSLRGELESRAAEIGVGQRVRFLGFVNQSELPAVYTAADVMVLPSEYEPFAVVVNEASCCGCPVISSDQVGAARDLIAPVDRGLIFPCGDVTALSGILRDLWRDRDRLRALGQAARQRMESWSEQDTVAGTVEAIRRAVSRKRNLPSSEFLRV